MLTAFLPLVESLQDCQENTVWLARNIHGLYDEVNRRKYLFIAEK